MAHSFYGIINYSPSKTCFATVPDSLLKDCMSKGIIVFKIINPSNTALNQDIFVSCVPKPSKLFAGNFETVVELNEKFAKKLKLSVGDKVYLQWYKSDVPAAKQVTIEPLTAEDSQILELNEKNIEKDLLSQIRVVWKNHTFPVFVKQSWFYIKIVKVNPDYQPILLENWTEVHIIPKRADGSLSDLTNNKSSDYVLDKYPEVEKGKIMDFLEKNELSEDTKKFISESEDKSKPESSGYSILGLVKSVLLSKQESPLGNLPSKDYLDTSTCDFDFTLRVLPYLGENGDGNVLPLAKQATTVFVNSSTFTNLTGVYKTPLSYRVILQKVLCPEERRRVKEIPKVSSSPRSKDKEKNSKNSIIIDDRETPFDSICVNMIILKSAHEDQFKVPKSLFYYKNCIVVPKELKRSLSLEVSSVVRCQSVNYNFLNLKMVVLHPVSSLPATVADESVSSAFIAWANSSIQKSRYLLISDGTLASLSMDKGRKTDFFIRIHDNNSSMNNSSLSSTSSLTSEGDKSGSVNKEPQYFFLDDTSIKNIIIKVGSQMNSSLRNSRPALFKPQELYQEIPAMCLESLGGINGLADKAMEDIEFWLKLRPLSYISNHPFLYHGCMLICGPKGVGKTTLAHALCELLVKFPYHIFVGVIQCLPLKGKRADNIRKKWDALVMEAIHRQPSVLVFDDLDYIASAPVSHEQEAGPEGVYFATIVQVFFHIVDKIINSGARVVVLVTSQSTHSLHPSLTNVKGRHAFNSILEIQPPNLEQRQDILSSLIKSKLHIAEETSMESVLFLDIASKTEGYVAQDLDSLVDRATHAAWIQGRQNIMMEKGQEKIKLTDEAFMTALEGYVPTTLRGIPLQARDHKTWNDIGGLSNVKKVIQQVILWPVKYKKVFVNYHLKPQTNILLYGAPGTGKTLLAGAVASECGLNFVSIKGPELLSKYIGASEQAIRDLFQRASSAKPCILFFDEFDSIAPRRGHDSTGVTDRVVNQLLTQLDGVESLEGVHVLAATSRPELIDPALLRPGRLDKCLLCPLPNEEERLEILKCLSTKLPLGDDVNFQALIPLTKYFSGADLQALLYSAHIDALHDIENSKSTQKQVEQQDKDTSTVSKDKLIYMPHIEDGIVALPADEGQKIAQDVTVIRENFLGIKEGLGKRRTHISLSISIKQRNLTKVVKEMKPSVSQQERLRYETTFQNFQNNLSGAVTTTPNQSIKRVTLA